MTKIEELLKIIERYKDYPVIVEGINDKKALEELGFKKIIVHNMASYKIAELLAKKKETVIILTDLDLPGKKKYKQLKQDLTRTGTTVNDTLRNFIFRHTQLRQIEGLCTYIINHQ